VSGIPTSLGKVHTPAVPRARCALPVCNETNDRDAPRIPEGFKIEVDKGRLAELSRSTLFYEPIPLPDGSQLLTLEDAANHIQKLPKATQDLHVWQFAVEMLINAADQGWPLMMAHIAILKGAWAWEGGRLGAEAEGDALGKRKLKRDQQ
jgi:hypothetical protein